MAHGVNTIGTPRGRASVDTLFAIVGLGIAHHQQTLTDIKEIEFAGRMVLDWFGNFDARRSDGVDRPDDEKADQFRLNADRL